MKAFTKFLIVGFVLIIISFSLFLDSYQEEQAFRKASEGLLEVGSTSLHDYEVMYILDKDHLCVICDDFYCSRNYEAGCEFCTDKCTWYYPIKSYFYDLVS